MIQTGPEWRVKLGDFGISKRISEDSELSSLVGTRAYMAPEMQGFLPPEEEENSLAWRFTKSIDMWSLGVTTYFLLFHDHPFSLDKLHTLKRYVEVEGSDFPFPKDMPQPLSLGCRQFLEAAMGRNPRNRMTSKEALESEWLSSIYVDPPEDMPDSDLDDETWHESSQHISLIPDRQSHPALFQPEAEQIQSFNESIVLASPALDITHDTSSTTNQVKTLVPPQHEADDPSPPHELTWDGSHYVIQSLDRDITSVCSDAETEAIEPAVTSPTRDDSTFATLISCRENSLFDSQSVPEVINNEELININLDLLQISDTSAHPKDDVTIRSEKPRINPFVPKESDEEKLVSQESADQVQPEAFPTDSPADLSTLKAKSPAMKFISTSPPSRDRTLEENGAPNGTRNSISGTRWKYDLKSKSWTASEEIVLSPDESHIGDTDTNDGEQTAIPTAASPSPSLITKGEARELQSIIESLSYLFREGEWLNGKKLHGKAQYHKAAELLEDIFTVQRDALGMMDEATMKTSYHLAQVYFRLKRYDKASLYFKYSTKWQHEALGPYHPDTLLSMRGFGCAEAEQGNSNEAETILRKTLNSQQATLGIKHEDTIQTSFELAQLLFSKDKWAEARFHFQPVISQRRGTAEEASRTMMKSLARSGFSSYELKDYDVAVEYLTEVLAFLKKSLKRPHGHAILTASILGKSLCHLGQYREARPILEEAVSMRRGLGITSRDDLFPFNALAECLLAMKDYKTARVICEIIVEEQKRILGPEHEETLISMFNLGRAYNGIGQHADLEAVLMEIQRLGSENPGSENAIVLQASHALGLIQYNRNECEIAQKNFELAATGRARLYGHVNKDALHSRLWHCRAQIAIEKYDAAEANCRQSLDYETEVYGHPLDHTLRNLELLLVAFHKGSSLEKAASLAELLVQKRKEKNGAMDSKALAAERVLNDIRLDMRKKVEELEELEELEVEQEKMNQRELQRERLEQIEQEKQREPQREPQKESVTKEQKSRRPAWRQSLKAKIKAIHG